MKRFHAACGLMLVAAVFSFQGCLYTQVQKKILPKHNEVLVFDLAFDLVYLRTLEALENVEGWELEETEKEKGIIRVRNVAYAQISDRDEQLATIQINRISRTQTSAQLSEDSQHLLGGEDLLKTISDFVSREL